MTVRQLGTECSSAELNEWMAMERLEPFGGQIDDLRAVIGPAAIINNLRRMFGDKDVEMLDARDLIPWFERAPEKVLFDPAESGYDEQAHGAALRRLLLGVSSRKEQPG